MKCYFSILYNQFEKTLGDFGLIFFCTFILIDCQYIYTVKRYIKTPKQGKLLNKVKQNKKENMYKLQTQYLPTMTIKAYQKLVNQGLP